MADATCVRYVTLEINCGFARTAIRELTPTARGRYKELNIQERASLFRRRFEGCDNYGIKDSYFSASKNGSLFDRDCAKLLHAFSKKWYSVQKRLEYLHAFSESKWKALPEVQKQQHTLSKCKACYQHFNELQIMFPQGPYYQESIISVKTEELKVCGERAGTRKALKELDAAFSNTFNSSFTQLVAKHGKGIQPTPTAAERKKKKREMLRQVRDKENKALKRAAAISVLTEDESQRAYQRKRKRQYFETPPQTKRNKTKSHSPDFSNVTWNKEEVLRDLQQHPEDAPPINWQQFAKEHSVPGQNAGQIVKEFAHKSGLDTSKLDRKLTNTTRVRSTKRKLLGNEISVPSTPALDTIKSEWKAMVDAGELSLGVSCVPYKMAKFTTKNGQLHKTETNILGRKFPLLELRKQFLKEHESYMRLLTDAEINEMSTETLLSLANQYCYTPQAKMSTDELQAKVKEFQRSRSLILWHDHGTILGLGCILITVHVAYDPAVFYTQAEYEEVHGNSLSIQSLVERPKLYIMAAGSPSCEDQIAIIQDRIDCLYDLSTKLVASNGVEVTDTLKFFIGDHPAQQFERGTQKGGRFKCGGCGVKSIMFGDLVHTLQYEWRSLQDLQTIAISGKFGKQPAVPKPFQGLLIQQLKDELQARGVRDTNKLKDVLKDQLDNILCGIQRVPTLLLFNPQQNLCHLNLQHYTVLDCEPLHDLKGHFLYLFEELPFLFKGEDRSTCEQVIAANRGSNMTCAKCRLCMIELFLHFQGRPIQQEILLLLETAIRMSELMYMEDANRNPRNVLRLYNCSWLHHELCTYLIANLHGSMTYDKLYGTYLHALVVHGPQQLEIISLRSVNTENQERFFESARRSASAASNRHPENVLSSTVLRLQAKAAFKPSVDAVTTANSIVARAGKEVPKFKGTKIPSSFVTHRTRSWQSHLQRISHYLLPGKGVWWDTDSTESEIQYRFFDGDDDPVSHSKGPNLRHHRTTTIKEVIESSISTWLDVVEKKIEVPASVLLVYDDQDIPTLSQTPLEDTEDMSTECNCYSTEQSNEIQPELPSNITSANVDTELENEETTDIVMAFDEDRDIMQTNPEPAIGTGDSEVHYETKHAKELANVIGCSEQLKEFDMLRARIKKNGKGSKEEKAKYQTLLCKLQLTVQRKRTNLLNKLGSIEKEYFMKHSKLPSLTDSVEYDDIMHKCRHINKLLRIWNLD